MRRHHSGIEQGADPVIGCVSIAFGRRGRSLAQPFVQAHILPVLPESKQPVPSSGHGLHFSIIMNRSKRRFVQSISILTSSRPTSRIGRR